jgi:hypothetical protein
MRNYAPLANTENPYLPPISTINETPVRRGPLRIAVYLFGSIGFAFLCWALLLVLFFGDSSDIWPGFACGAIAISACLAVVYWVALCRWMTWTIVAFYVALDFLLFIAFVASMLYWRIYIYTPHP